RHRHHPGDRHAGGVDGADEAARAGGFSGRSTRPGVGADPAHDPVDDRHRAAGRGGPPGAGSAVLAPYRAGAGDHGGPRHRGRFRRGAHRTGIGLTRAPVTSHHTASTFSPICWAIRTAESPGSALHVLTSPMMLLRRTSARPHPQPGCPASRWTVMAFRMSPSLVSSATYHLVPLWVWRYSWQAGHCSADASKNARAVSASGNN